MSNQSLCRLKHASYVLRKNNLPSLVVICPLSVATDGKEDDQIECFKEGHSCSEGRAILQQENEAFQSSLTEATGDQEMPMPELNHFLLEEEAEEEEEVIVD